MAQAYIIERAEKTPQLELLDPLINGIQEAYAARGIIYRLNGLWPRTMDLFKWIYTTWTKDCEISLCSKGFFTVYFHNIEDY